MAGGETVKIVVTGNCQARPMAKFFENSENFFVLEPIILHLAKSEDLEKYIEALEEAEFILAQRTDGSFPLVPLRSDELRGRYAEKVIVWPNIFFNGQQPFLRYISHQKSGRILGPLEASHDLRIFSEWLVSRHGQDLFSCGFENDYVSQVSQRSLANLREREEDCDVIVSDIIEQSSNKKLFFTFNHPTSYLLTQVVNRILEKMGVSQVFDHNNLDEPLGMYRVPSLWDNKDSDLTFRGRECFLDGGSRIKLGKVRCYSEEELRIAFFDAYDHVGCLADLELLRVTPNYPGCRLDGPFST